MAFTAREVIMVFRGQNYLSSAIRRVGRDVGGLSRTAQLAQQGAQLRVVNQRLTQSRNIAAAEFQSVKYGSRAIALQQAKNSLNIKEQRQIEGLHNIETSRLRNMSQMITATQRLENIQAITAGLSKSQTERMVIGNLPASEALKKAALDVKVLQAEAGNLTEQYLRQNQVIAQSSIATQQLAAREAELFERESQLLQIVHTRTRAIQENTLAQMQNDFEASKILPVQNWQRRAAAIEHAGRVLQMFGLIATATFGYLAKATADFNTQMQTAATQATVMGQNTVANVQRIGAVLQKELTNFLLSGKSLASPQELGQAAYEIPSGLAARLSQNQGEQIKQIIYLIKQFNQVAAANPGLVKFNDVVSAGISIINNFGIAIKDVPEALNTMQAAVRFGRMTMGEFLSTLNQAAPAGKAAGYSFQEVASSIAFLSTKFPSISYASAGYARLTELLLRNAAAFRAQGVEVEKASGGLRPMNQIIGEILKKWPELATGQMNLIEWLKSVTGSAQAVGFVQARRALIAYLQDLKGARKIVGDVVNDNNELVKSAIAAGTSPGAAWTKFTNQLRGLVLLLGQGAIPAFAKLGAPIVRVLHYISQLSPHTQRLIGYVGALTSAFLLLGSTLAIPVAAIGRLVAGIMIVQRAKSLENLIKTTRAQQISEAPAIVEQALKPQIIDPATGKTFAETGAVATKLTGEVGQARVGLAAMSGALFGVLVPLILFHKQVSDVVNVLGGFGRVLTLISSLLLILSFTKGITGLIKIVTEAKTASEALVILRSNLLAISGLVVTATVLVIERHQIVNAARGAVQSLNQQFGAFQMIDPTTGLPTMHYGPGAIGWLQKNLGAQATQGVGGFFNRILGRNGYSDAIKTLSARYIEFLSLMGKEGSPKALQQFQEALKQSGITAKTSDEFFQEWLKTYQSNQGTLAKGMKDLGTWATHLNAVRNKLRRAFQEGYTTPAMKNQQAVKAQETMLQQVQKVTQLYSKATTAGTYNDWVAYYNALDKLQKKYKGAQLEALNEILSAQRSAIDSSVKQTQVTFEDAFSGLQNLYQSMLSQEQQNFGQLFQGPWMQSPMFQTMMQWGHRITPRDVTKDLQQQISQYREFNNLLTRLSRRGAPEELVNQLRQLGPSAINQIRAMTRMSDPEIKKYFGLFKTAQDQIHQQTMTDLNNKLKDYLQYGRNIALQIIAGITSEQVPLTNALKEVLKKAFGNLPTQASLQAGQGASLSAAFAAVAQTKAQSQQKTAGAAGKATAGNVQMPPLAPTQFTPGLAERGTGAVFVVDATRLQEIADSVGRIASPKVLYRSLAIDIINQYRQSGLPVPNDRRIENIIAQDLYINAPPKWDIPRIPRRQYGGPVMPFGQYWVGEKGPEIFTPKTPGYITPNIMRPTGGSSSGKTVHQHYSPTIQVIAPEGSNAVTQAKHAEFALRQKWNDFHRH